MWMIPLIGFLLFAAPALAGQASELGPILKAALQRDVPAVFDCPVDAGENLRLTQRLQSLPHGQ
jgi:hypothetical protein